MKKRKKKTILTHEQVLENLSKIALNEETERTNDRLKALELIAKMTGMFDKKEEQEQFEDDGFLEALEGKVDEIWEE